MLFKAFYICFVIIAAATVHRKNKNWAKKRNFLIVFHQCECIFETHRALLSFKYFWTFCRLFFCFFLFFCHKGNECCRIYIVCDLGFSSKVISNYFCTQKQQQWHRRSTF